MLIQKDLDCAKLVDLRRVDLIDPRRYLSESSSSGEQEAIVPCT